MEAILTKLRGKTTRMSYAGRNASASPATGLASRHKYEQQTLVAQALGLK
jgi:2-oxoglutarate dehydrogenase E1 component